MDKYSIKRDLLSLSGLLGIRWNSLNSGVYVFNYHRIGDPDNTKFDPNVFSCSEPQFASHLELLKSRFEIISIKGAIEFSEGNQRADRPLAIITFDDGYLDNYKNALPILEKYEVAAAFFLPTDFIGTKKIPWWDEAAWLIKNSKQENIKLPGLEGSISIGESGKQSAILRTLRHLKDNTALNMDEKMSHLRESCGCELDIEQMDSLFMSWDQIRELGERGMELGSHGLSHSVLSHLDIETQRNEISMSKEIIEKQTGASVYAFAYPVGAPATYTDDTVQVVKECGYRIAFNHIYGFNPLPLGNPFKTSRISIKPKSDAIDLKYTAAYAPANPA